VNVAGEPKIKGTLPTFPLPPAPAVALIPKIEAVPPVLEVVSKVEVDPPVLEGMPNIDVPLLPNIEVLPPVLEVVPNIDANPPKRDLGNEEVASLVCAAF